MVRQSPASSGLFRPFFSPSPLIYLTPAHDAGRALAGGMGTPGAARGSCDAYAPFEMMNRAVTAGDFRRYHSIVHCDAAP